MDLQRPGTLISLQLLEYVWAGAAALGTCASEAHAHAMQCAVATRALHFCAWGEFHMTHAG